jgi:hypothetical protein
MNDFRPYAGDPLSVLAIDRLRLSPALAALIMVGLTLVVDAVSFAIAGASFFRAYGWSDVWAYGIYQYVVMPLVAAAFVWVSTGAARMFERLGESDALLAPRTAYHAFLYGPLRRAFTHPGWSAASLIVTITLAVYYTFFFTDTSTWARSVFAARAAKVLLLYIPSWYMVCQIVARQIVSTWGLFHVFDQFTVTPHPLHPDRCGGLRAIHDYAVGFGYIIALIGLGVLVQIVTAWRTVGRTLTPDVLAMTGLYVALGVAFFFLPLWTAHTAMRNARRAMLSDIAARFQTDYAEAVAGLPAPGEDWTRRVDRLEDMRTLYQMTETFPVWPFDAGTLGRFLITFIVPLLPVFIELAVTLGQRPGGG